MHLLILGGTKFLGRHVVDAALARGHTVTLFNRGKTAPDLFPDVERLVGDRNGDLGGNLGPLVGRRFDAVVDTCGYVPRVVAASARLLADLAEHYTFISSGSVYPHPVAPGIDETAEVGTLGDPAVEEVTGDTYGPLKVLCERAARDAFGDRALIVRSGLIVGPHDPTDRFTYWPLRVARGGRVLCPPDAPVQFIDVRDQAEWIVAMAERRQGGVFNVTSPPRAVTLADVLESARRISNSDAEFVWTDASFLAEQGIEEWSDMPLWVRPENEGFSLVSVERALAAGLTFRPLDDTVRDTLAWAQARPPGGLRAGITAEREAAALEAYDSGG